MSNLAQILQWLHPQTALGIPWALQDDGDGPRIVAWSVPGVEQPTVQEVLDWEADWLAAGGAFAEIRRKAAAALSDQADATRALIHAVVLETLDYANRRFTTIADTLRAKGTITAAERNAFVAALATPQQARAAILARIDAGEADT